MAVITRLSFLVFTNAAYLPFQPKTEAVTQIRIIALTTWNVADTLVTWNVAQTFTTWNVSDILRTLDN